jgi:ribosome-interacting GTPase 1
MMKFENVKVQLVDTPPISPGATEPWMYGLVQSADSAVLLVDCSADDCLEQVENVCADLKTRKIELTEAAPSSRGYDGSYLVSTVVVGNKMDKPGAAENLAALAEIYKGRFNPVGICATKPDGLDEFRRLAFKSLGKVRVHCKQPGKPADLNDPFTLKIGSTVTDFAQTIHKDVARTLQFARVWGSGRHDGLRVPRDFVLSDGDIVEVHAAE